MIMLRSEQAPLHREFDLEEDTDDWESDVFEDAAVRYRRTDDGLRYHWKPGLRLSMDRTS